MSDLVPVVFEFEGHKLTTLEYKGRPAWIAREVGTAIGYAQNGKRLATRITCEWSDELIDGHDFSVIKGHELQQLQELLNQGYPSGTFKNSKSLTVLFESGVHIALLKTKKDAGKRLRRFLASEVLPQIVKKGSYVPIKAQPHSILDAKTQALIARENRLAKKLEVDTRRFESKALEGLVKRLRESGTVSKEVCDACDVKAAEIATGRDLSMLRPEDLEPDWVSPSEIAKRAGVSTQRIGRIITKLGVRNAPGKSKAVINKARGHGRQVTTYIYNPETADEIVAEVGEG